MYKVLDTIECSVVDQIQDPATQEVSDLDDLCLAMVGGGLGAVDLG
jgi:hypothetical protein